MPDKDLGLGKKKGGHVCVYIFCISEALESHVHKNSKAGRFKFNLASFERGWKLMLQFWPKSFGHKIIIIIILTMIILMLLVAVILHTVWTSQLTGYFHLFNFICFWWQSWNECTSSRLSDSGLREVTCIPKATQPGSSRHETNSRFLNFQPGSVIGIREPYKR